MCWKGHKKPKLTNVNKNRLKKSYLNYLYKYKGNTKRTILKKNNCFLKKTLIFIEKIHKHLINNSKKQNKSEKQMIMTYMFHEEHLFLTKHDLSLKRNP